MKAHQKKYLIPAVLFSCLTLNGVAFAGGYTQEPVAPQNQDYFEIIGAGSLSELDPNHVLMGVTSSETDGLVQTNQNVWDTWGGQLGVGFMHFFRNAVQFPEHTQWFPSAGPQINGYYLSNSHGIKGDVWLFNNSAWNQKNYVMAIESGRVMLDGVITIVSKKRMSLYVKGGVGNAWNRGNYSDTNNASSDCSFNPPMTLNAHTNSDFAWEAGAGLLFGLSHHLGLSVEYLYADLGNITTSAQGTIDGSPVTIVVPPKFDLKTQNALLGLHFTFGQ